MRRKKFQKLVLKKLDHIEKAIEIIEVADAEVISFTTLGTGVGGNADPDKEEK